MGSLGENGRFCDLFAEKGRLEGTSGNFQKNKVQLENWAVPLNGPLYKIICRLQNTPPGWVIFYLISGPKDLFQELGSLPAGI